MRLELESEPFFYPLAPRLDLTCCSTFSIPAFSFLEGKAFRHGDIEVKRTLVSIFEDLT